MDRKYFEELKKIDTQKIAFDFANHLRALVSSDSVQSSAISIATVLFEMERNKSDNKDTVISKLALNDDAKEILASFTADMDCLISELKGNFTPEQLVAFILFDNSLEDFKMGSDESTPTCLSKLSNKILDIQDNDKVLDLCSGKGSFAVEQYSLGNCKNYRGVEINYNSKFISDVRGYFLGDNYAFTLGNALDSNINEQFDKIFSNYPFGLRLVSMNDQKQKLIEKMKIDESIMQRASSDWLFNSVIFSSLKDNGKAVAIMTNGATWNKNDEKIRKYFVENGFVEAVISLPAKLFNSTMISTTMIIFSRNNKSVRLIDASDIYISERRKNNLDDKCIMNIVELLAKDSSKSILMDLRKFAENEYILNPVRYFEEAPEIKNGVEFGQIIKNITRGSQLKAADIDLLKSNVETDYQYLMISNINNGALELGEEQYLKEIPSNLEKYCVSNNSIILSKTGTPVFKSTVASVKAGKKLLANGNMFVIELDESKVNPYYVQAFLSSDIGRVVLKNICSGTTISTISLDKLKKMIVPLPKLEEQTEIATKYAASVDELILLKKKIEKITTRMSHVFDEEV